MGKNNDVSEEIRTLLEDIKKDRSSLEKDREKLEKLKTDLTSKLEKISSITKEEAKKLLLDLVQKELTQEISKKIKTSEERIKEESKEKAKEILVDAMRHGVTNYTAEYTVSSVIVDQEAKGRIIGREGRNIRTFERETQVEIEIDEGREIRLSSFDAIRREIARRSLEVLLKDTRIQPSRIEEVVHQTKLQMEDILIEEGKIIAHECGVYNLPLDLIKLIGRYKFRTSYGQNLGIHTIEETKIGVSIAQEIGAKVEIVRLGCLLHDIGKVVTDLEGTHVQVGVETLKKFGLPKEVINAVAEHHEDKPFSSIESIIVWIADSASGSRPGARYEPHEEYVKRLTKIEEIAKNFEGVKEVYAFQSGRDVRVIVDPEEVDDDRLTILSNDIARNLEKEAQYTGQIKVSVIREVRSVSQTAAK